MATDDDAAPKLTIPAPTPAKASEPRARRTDAQRAADRAHPPGHAHRAPPTPCRRDDKLNETIRQRLEHLVPELVKKTFAAGMGAVFSTEEGIRKIAREVSLPDVVGYVASSADGAKDKVFEIVARETREFLANLNLTEEIAKILTTLSFEIKTEIRFIPNSERHHRRRARRQSIGEGEAERQGGRRDRREDRDSRSRLRFWRRDGEAERRQWDRQRRR